MALPKWARDRLKKRIPAGTLKRMEEVAKAIGDTPPLEDQAEWEAELLRKLEAERDEEQPTTKEGSEDERD